MQICLIPYVIVVKGHIVSGNLFKKTDILESGHAVQLNVWLTIALL